MGGKICLLILHSCQLVVYRTVFDIPLLRWHGRHLTQFFPFLSKCTMQIMYGLSRFFYMRLEHSETERKICVEETTADHGTALLLFIGVSLTLTVMPQAVLVNSHSRAHTNTRTHR